MSRDDPADWVERLRGVIASGSIRTTDRVEVVSEAASTQDVAFERSGGKPGLMVLAVRQTAGRGRLGRGWVQRGELGLAATFVLDAGTFDPTTISLASGLAAAKALEGRVPSMPEFGLRWPNDVVEPSPRPGGGRKVAGVLVEVRDGLALVGIGVNVRQREGDFPEELRSRAVSLHQLGSDVLRIEVAEGLVQGLHWALSLPKRLLAKAWAELDVLVGSTQEFVHDGRRFSGMVESIDPANEIVLRTGAGTFVRLPALSTSLVRE